MLIAVTSLKGSPGVTTTVTALAAQWPAAAGTHRLVVEVDPCGGDLAVRFGLPLTPGVVSWAADARGGAARSVWEHTQALPALAGGVRVLAAPPGAQSGTAWRTALAAGAGDALATAASAAGVVVLADCGRAEPDSPAVTVARHADALVLVTGSQGDELAHVAPRLRELAAWTPRPGLVLTGRGYATGEVERALGVAVLARLPHDPTTAAALTGRRPLSRRGSGLVRATAALARTLATPHPPPALAPSAPSAPSASSPSSGPVDAVVGGQVPGVPAQRVRPGGPVTAPPPRPDTTPAEPGPAGSPGRSGTGVSGRGRGTGWVA